MSDQCRSTGPVVEYRAGGEVLHGGGVMAGRCVADGLPQAGGEDTWRYRRQHARRVARRMPDRM